jgi:hypothetical protein
VYDLPSAQSIIASGEHLRATACLYFPLDNWPAKHWMARLAEVCTTTLLGMGLNTSTVPGIYDMILYFL